MRSRVYGAVMRWKKDNPTPGGRGLKSPSSFIRLSENVLSDFDDLLREFTLKYWESQNSPRSKRLFELIDRINELLPPGSEG